MGWENLDLGEIASNDKAPQAAPPPEGTYICRLLGVKNSQFVAGRYDFDFVIDEGQYKGRRVFPTLPEPDGPGHWAAKAAARFLYKVLGGDQQEGETPIAALSRMAAGQPKFTAPLVHVTYKSVKEGGEVTKADLKQWFSLEASA